MRHPARILAPALAALSALSVLAALASACSSKPPLEVEHFTIASPAGPIPDDAPGARLVGLAPIRVSPLFVDPSLVYRLGGDRVEVDPYASLAAAPRALIGDALRASLLRHPAVQDVVSGLVGPSGLTVEVFLQEISGDFSRPDSPAAVLSLEIATYRGDPRPGDLPVLRKVYTRREPLQKRTAAAVVAAWNSSLPSIVAELGADLAAIPPVPRR